MSPAGTFSLRIPLKGVDTSREERRGLLGLDIGRELHNRFDLDGAILDVGGKRMSVAVLIS